MMIMAEFSDFETEQAVINRNRKLAEMLQMQSMTPESGQMVSGHYVAPSNLSYLNKIAQALVGGSNQRAADEQQSVLKQKMNADRTGAIQRYSDLLQGKEAVAPTLEAQSADTMGPPQMLAPGQAGVAPNRRAAVMELMKAKDPQLQQFGMQQMLKEPTMDKGVVLGRTMVHPVTGKTIAIDATWKEEQDIARAAKAEELKIKMADQQASRAERAEAQKQLAQMQIDGRREMAGIAASMRQAPAPTLTTIVDPNNPNKSIVIDARTGARIGESPGKPKAVIPTSALKMQQEELEAIGTNATIDADIGAIRNQIKDKKLNLGPVNNIVGTVRNAVGASSEESRNLASFKATMEKMRNDSLRLNKGVQTEGDAVRAWNEIFANINDAKVVDQRLSEIQEINKRGSSLRKMNVDAIRANYGADPLDTAPISNQPAAIGVGAKPSANGWSIKQVQ